MYEQTPLLSLICEFYPERMLKGEFVNFSFTDDTEEDETLSRSFYDWLTNYSLTDSIYDALVKANIYGTYLLLVDVEESGDRNLSDPLDKSKVREIIKMKGVRFDLAEVEVRDSEEDFQLGIAGTYYKIGNDEWHESRVLRFDTTSIIEDPKESSLSLLVKVESDYNYYVQVHETVEKITTSASVPVLGIEGLGAKLNDPDTREFVQRRLALAKESIERMGAIAIDKKTESFEYEERNLSGLGDIVQIGKDRLSAATGIPETSLFQRSSQGGGLSDSGLGERALVAGKTSALQTRQLKTPVTFLAELWAAMSNYTGKITFDFAPTLELTRKEVAEIEKLEAETEKILGEDSNPSPPPGTRVVEEPTNEEEGERENTGDSLGKFEAGVMPGVLNSWGSLEAEITGDEVEIAGSALSATQQAEIVERGVNLSSLRAARPQTKRVLSRGDHSLASSPDDLEGMDSKGIFETLGVWNNTKVEGFDKTVTRFIEGKITLTSFQTQMIEDIMKNSLILANGFVPESFFDDDDNGGAEGFVEMLRDQIAELVGYLDTMIRNLKDRGEASERLIRYRVRRYIEYQNSFLQESFRLLNFLAGATEERRITDDRFEHCTPCVDYARVGWAPLYSFPVPLQLCDCANNCKCSIIFR